MKPLQSPRLAEYYAGPDRTIIGTVIPLAPVKPIETPAKPEEKAPDK